MVNRIVVFGTPRNMALLGESKEWYLDGTFKSCPSIFYQIYTIQIKLPEGNIVPVVYSLLPGKTQQTYHELLSILTNFLNNSRPECVHMDFEISMVKEIEKSFPGVQIIGCNFHFNQCLWRHIQGDGPLLRKYLANNDFALGVRMFAAIAFVPESDIRSVFAALLESEFVREHNYILTKFINYFETTWVGRERNPAIMKSHWWNVHGATLEGRGRTNNEMEGWHSAFAGRLDACHPTFFKLVNQLKAEQGLSEFIVSNSHAQGYGAYSRPAYRKKQENLYRKTWSYRNTPKLRFSYLS